MILESLFSLGIYPKIYKQNLRVVASGVKKISHEEEFLDKLSGDSLVVVDGYHFNTAYQKRIKAIGSKLICIDDLFWVIIHLQ